MTSEQTLPNDTAQETEDTNPLATQPIGKLIFKYSLPAIISSLVSSVYNIVDQIFIGWKMGELGNAATNVAFPLVMICATLAMTFGVGGASAFSLYLGQKEEGKAKKIAGNAMFLMILIGILLSVITLVCLKPLLYAFGGRDQTLEYAVEYTRITAFGYTFAILGTGATQLIRANGSPRYAMIASLTGAVLNCILDPVFIFVCNMGMAGAAYATIIGQAVSAVLIIVYFAIPKFFHMHWKDYLPDVKVTGIILRLGLAAGANQLAITLMQVVMNNTLGSYGEASIYGRDIPLACVGVISKVNAVFNSVIFGISQSTQPIIGYNYSAGKQQRAKKTFYRALIIVICISSIAFLLFQIIPRQLTSIFGSGDELYYEFATKYFRIFLACTILAGVQILCSNFFPSIGKGGLGMVISLSRQVFFLLPLVLVFPLIFGIDGVLYAGPISDGLAGIISFLLVWREIRKWKIAPQTKT